MTDGNIYCVEMYVSRIQCDRVKQKNVSKAFAPALTQRTSHAFTLDI